MANGELTGRVMFKCPRCKERWAKDYPVSERTVTKYRRYFDSVQTYTVTERSIPTSEHDINGRCPHCNYGYLTVGEVRGTVSASHKCDSRCLNAKRGDCECQCGGANHGKGLLLSEAAILPNTTTTHQDDRQADTVERLFRALSLCDNN